MRVTEDFNINDKITIEGYGYDEDNDLCMDGHKYHKEGKAKGIVTDVHLIVTSINEFGLHGFIAPPAKKGD